MTSVDLSLPTPVGAKGILILSLASACACRCVFCNLPETAPHTELPAEVLAAALDGPPNGNAWEEVNLTGGDPLVIPGARELFDEVLARRSRFASLSVSTAGIPARSALIGLRMLSAHTPLDLYVSLDGIGEMHDRIRGRRGAFNEVEAFLSEASNRPGVRISLTCVINRLNVDHLDEVADYADAVRLPVSYAIVNDSDHYINSQPLYSNVALTREQTQLAIDFLNRRSSQRLDDDLVRVLLGGKRQLPCRLLRGGFLVTSDGTVSICGTSQRMILGSALEGSDPNVTWRALTGRRAQLLDAGVASVCGDCSTNCYAWRKSDDAVTA